jgi:hypothetical protein
MCPISYYHHCTCGTDVIQDVRESLRGTACSSFLRFINYDIQCFTACVWFEIGPSMRDCMGYDMARKVIANVIYLDLLELHNVSR